MCRPGGSGLTPLSWVSPNFCGMTIILAVSPSKSLTFPLMIYVWNGPRHTFSLMMMASSTSASTGAAQDPASSPSGASPPLSGAVTAKPLLESNCDNHAIAQGTDSLSILLSQTTFIILPSVQVPVTSRTCLEDSDSSGMTRKTMSSSYPVISLTCTQRIMKPSGLVYHPPKPVRFSGWSTKSTSGRMGSLC